MSLVTYPLIEHRLSNGLRVLISPDRTAPAVAVNIWYAVGSRHETPGRTGFAHLFEHIMFQGSANVASGDHIGLLQAAGAAVNATTWFDRTNYFEALPTGGLDLALWLEADRLGTLLTALTQANLDNQRDVVKEEKRQRYDNVPYGDVLERLVRLTFPPDHPYGHTTIGSMEDLDAASLADVRAFFTAYYRPNNAVLTLVGDVDPDEARAKVERYFGSIEAGEVPPAPAQDPLTPLAEQPRDQTSAAVPAEAVHLTWRLPAFGTPLFDAAELAMSILGDGQTARLHRALVRGDEIAQAAGASSLGLVAGNSFGFASARAREDVDVRKLEDRLVEEVARLGENGPTEDELYRAKAQFERAWLQSLSSLDSRADQISAFATLLDDPGRINTRIEDVMAIETDAVRQACRDFLGPESRATLVYRREDS